MHRKHRLPRHWIGIGGLTISALLIIIALFLFLNTPSSRNTVLPIVNRVFHSGPPITCKTPHHDPGNATATLTSSGMSRTFLIHLAPSYGDQAQPLVINYHGYDMTSNSMKDLTGMDHEADKAGFVLVFPQAVDSPTSWNAGVGAYGPTGDADDIQFTRDLLTTLETNYCVDPHRVYLAGFSLGGGMVYRLACNLGDQIAAIATVSGAYYPFDEDCHVSHPLPVLEIHGAADPLAPYVGNPDRRLIGVQAYLNAWLSRDKCDQTSDLFYQQGDVTGTEWTHCAGGAIVSHYRVSDGRHHWPRNPPYSMDSNVAIWDFFSKFSYPLPTPSKK